MNIKVAELTGPRAIRIAEDVLPEPTSEQVEIRSLYSGISHGTEMNVYRGDAPMWDMSFDSATRLFSKTKGASFEYPIRYGYCCVGEVVKLGAGVTKLKKGDIVYCEEPHASGHVLKESSPMKLPTGLDPKAGVFFSNLKTTFIGMLDAGVRLQETVAVFGQGTLGQLIVQWSKLAGASQVVAMDLNDTRLGFSKNVSGADATFNPKNVDDVALEIRKLTENRGADVAIEVSASDRALNEAIRTVGLDGRVIVLSWYPNNLANVFPGREFHHNRIKLLCSQCAGIAPELANRWTDARVTESVMARMPELKLAPLVSHVVDIDDVADAYTMIADAQEDVMQVVLKY